MIIKKIIDGLKYISIQLTQLLKQLWLKFCENFQNFSKLSLLEKCFITSFSIIVVLLLPSIAGFVITMDPIMDLILFPLFLLMSIHAVELFIFIVTIFSTQYWIQWKENFNNYQMAFHCIETGEIIDI